MVRPITPAIKALGRLVRDVNSASDGLLLIEWRRGDVDAQTMSASIWLVLALAALRSGNHEVRLIQNIPRDGERFAHTFRDARAYSRVKIAAQSAALEKEPV